MRLSVALFAALLGCWLCVAGWPAFSVEPIDSIPLPAASLATPIAVIGKPPPLRSTPFFVSTQGTPTFMSNWQMATLKRWYLPDPDRGQMGS